MFNPSFRSDLCSETEICESLWFDSINVRTDFFSSRTRVMVEELGYVGSNLLDSVAKPDFFLVCRYRSRPKQGANYSPTFSAQAFISPF